MYKTVQKLQPFPPLHPIILLLQGRKNGSISFQRQEKNLVAENLLFYALSALLKLKCYFS